MSRYWEPAWVPEPSRKDVPKKPTPQEDAMLASFCNLRQDTIEIEEILGCAGVEWSEKDRKRLDKAVTLIKAGTKIAKKVLRSHGARTSIAKRGVGNGTGREAAAVRAGD